MLFRALSLFLVIFGIIVTHSKAQTDSGLVKKVGEIILNKLLEKYWLEIDSVELIFYFPKTNSIIVSVNMDEPSSHAKRIFINFSEGALSLGADQQELAWTLGHELGHINVCLKNLELTGLCIMPNENFMTFQSYLEYESKMDYFGLIVMKDNGYDPKRAVSILEKRIDFLRKQGVNDNESFLDFLNCRLLKLKISLDLISRENVSCGSGLQLPFWPTKP